MMGYVFTVFQRYGKQCIGIVPYTQKTFGGQKQYAWGEVRYHRINTSRRLRPDTADLFKMAHYIDRNTRGYRRNIDAMIQLETWIQLEQPAMAGRAA